MSVEPEPGQFKPNGVSRHTIADILGNSRRLYAVHLLDRFDAAISTRDLAIGVAAMEYDCPQSEVTSKQKKRVYVSLYQNHLPELEKVGLVREVDDATFAPGPRLSEIADNVRAWCEPEELEVWP